MTLPTTDPADRTPAVTVTTAASRPGGRRRAGLTAFALGAVLALGLAACGGDDDDAATSDTTSGDAGGEVTTTAGADDPYGSPSDSGSDDAAAGDGGAAGGDAVAYEVTEISYSDVSAPAGGTIEVTNSTSAPHTFTADDESFEVEYEAGDTVTVDVPAEPGEYPFHCEVHPSMQATLTAE